MLWKTFVLALGMYRHIGSCSPSLPIQNCEDILNSCN